MVHLAAIFQNLPNPGAIKVNNICSWNLWLCMFQLDNEVEPLVRLLDSVKNMFIPLQIAANSQTKNPSVGDNFKLVTADYDTHVARRDQIL